MSNFPGYFIGFSPKACPAPMVKSKMRKIGVKSFFIWAYGLERMYKKECIFDARPLVIEIRVFKWFFKGTEMVEWIFFSNGDKFSAEAILNAIWKVRAPCLLDIFKIKE